MITVILRDGRVLQYNGADNADQAKDHFRIFNEKTNHWFAKFPMDVVERIDGLKPCRILKESRNKKKMKTY